LLSAAFLALGVASFGAAIPAPLGSGSLSVRGAGRRSRPFRAGGCRRERGRPSERARPGLGAAGTRGARHGRCGSKGPAFRVRAAAGGSWCYGTGNPAPKLPEREGTTAEVAFCLPALSCRLAAPRWGSLCRRCPVPLPSPPHRGPPGVNLRLPRPRWLQVPPDWDGACGAGSGSGAAAVWVFGPSASGGSRLSPSVCVCPLQTEGFGAAPSAGGDPLRVGVTRGQGPCAVTWGAHSFSSSIALVRERTPFS